MNLRDFLLRQFTQNKFSLKIHSHGHAVFDMNGVYSLYVKNLDVDYLYYISRYFIHPPTGRTLIFRDLLDYTCLITDKNKILNKCIVNSRLMMSNFMRCEVDLPGFLPYRNKDKNYIFQGLVDIWRRLCRNIYSYIK